MKLTRRALLATIALAHFFAPAVLAQTASTIKIGNEIKNATGVVRQLQNGDISCVMVMQDEQGKEFIEAAQFDICFQKPSLIGRRVGLKYRMENVQAESCQGDPACKKTTRIALVVEAKIIDARPGAQADARPAKSFCMAQEEVVFNCAVGQKRVSVCAAGNAPGMYARLQYRFGKAGIGEQPELKLPADEVPATKPATKPASGGSLAFSGGGAAWLRFSKPPYAYVVYTGIGKWGRAGEVMEKQGVVVERGGKAISTLKCSGRVDSLLGPDWFEKAGIRSNGEDFDLPD